MKNNGMIEKIIHVLKPGKEFYIVSTIYGIGVSILSLIIPISVQTLVNTVTFSALTQPLVVVSLLILSVLVFSGILRAIQIYTIEMLQRYFYKTTSLDMSEKILGSDLKKFGKTNATSLVDRYFDIMTIQKTLTTLLTDGVSLILKTIVGLLLLAFYHPYFIAFDIILIVFIIIVWRLFGARAMYSSVEESKAKYKVASWLQELARMNDFFKPSRRALHAKDVSKYNINTYLLNRKKHFRAVFAQAIGFLTIYAFMSSLILALGGYLVLIGELTIGQLVAAELIITVILSSLSQAGKYFESFYDLYAAVDKIHYIYELKQEKLQTSNNAKMQNHTLQVENASYGEKEDSYQFNHTFEEGKKYYLESSSTSAKLFLVDLLTGYLSPKKGRVLLGGVPYTSLSLGEIRDVITLIKKPHFFEASILENLTFGLSDVSESDVRSALEVVDLEHYVDSLKNGINTTISPTGYPFWESQLIRIEMARVLIQKPKFLIIMEIIDQVDEVRRERFLNEIFKMNTTLLLFSNHDFSTFRFDQRLKFSKKEIEVINSSKNEAN